MSQDNLFSIVSSTLTTIIDNARLGVWEWNVETGETKFNKNWAEILGYTLEELFPININTWIRLTHPDDLVISDKKLKEHFEGKNDQYHCEARMRHKNGHWVWVLDTGKVIKWTRKGKPLLMTGIHQDITPQKLAEQELYQKLKLEKIIADISSKFIQTDDIDTIILDSFAKLAAVNNASRVYLFLIDHESKTMSNTHEWCNTGVTAEIENLKNLPLETFPWWMEQLENNNIIDVYDVSQMPAEAITEREILESQEIKSVLVLPLFIENKLFGFVGFDNVITTNNWSGQEIQMLKLLADILSNAIKRKQANEKLQLLTKAVEGSPVSTMITDSCSKIIYVNRSFTEINSYTLEEIIGKNPSILGSKKQSNSFYQNMWNTILNQNSWQGELQNETKDGKLYWANVLIYPIINEGNITHFVSLTQDISVLRKLDSDLLKAKVKAEESDRLKSAFLATMSHELRTPLNHIMGFSDMIPDMTDDENIKEISKIIYQSGSNLLSIIEDIFDLAMMERSEITIRDEVVIIRDLFLELKKELQSLVVESDKSESIRLVFKIESGIVMRRIITDKLKVKQVVSNLLRNAVKFTFKGQIVLEMQEKDNRIEFKVKDTGIGIRKDKQKIIFGFFVQADDSQTREFGGTGIGLAISQRIARAMGGKITVHSKPGSGSEFTYSFPVRFLEK